MPDYCKSDPQQLAMLKFGHNLLMPFNRGACVQGALQVHASTGTVIFESSNSPPLAGSIFTGRFIKLISNIVPDGAEYQCLDSGDGAAYTEARMTPCQVDDFTVQGHKWFVSDAADGSVYLREMASGASR
jgi:hypothetical protein